MEIMRLLPAVEGHDLYIVTEKNRTSEKTVAEMLVTNVKKAIEQTGVTTIALAGGVAANSYIRSEFEKIEGAKIYMPDLKLCTDNGAMIASAGYYDYLGGISSDLTLNAYPNLKLGK